MLGSPNTVLKGPLLRHGSCCQRSEQTLFCRVGTPCPPYSTPPRSWQQGSPQQTLPEAAEVLG